MICALLLQFFIIYKGEEESYLPHPLLSRFRHHCGFTNASNSDKEIQKAHTNEVILITFCWILYFSNLQVHKD